MRQRNNVRQAPPLFSAKWAYASLILIILLAYAWTIGFGFINFDDVKLVALSRQQIESSMPLGKILTGDAFGSEKGIFYHRPVLSLSLLWDAYIGKGAPWPFHLTNVLLHILAVCLFMHLMVQAGHKIQPAFYAALLVGLHPALVQAVAWIPGRNDVLLAIFLMLSAIGLARYLKGGVWGWLLLGLASYFLALFTKETAVFSIILLLVWLLVYQDKNGKTPKIIIGLSAIFASLVWFAVRSLASSGRTGDALPLLGSLHFAPKGLLSYIGKTVLPLGLSLVPDYGDANVILGLIPAALLTIIFLRWKPARPKYFILGILCYGLFLIPAVLNESYLEHRLYVPLFGLLAAGMETGILSGFSFNNKNRLVFSSGLAVALLIININHASVFKDEQSAWKAAAQASPNSWIANNAMGIISARQGRLQDAEFYYIKALKANPDNPKIKNNLGLMYLRTGHTQQAIDAFQSILKSDRTYSGANYNMAQAMEQLKRFDQAIEFYKAELVNTPQNTDAMVALGAVLTEIGKLDMAREYLLSALAINPSHYDALINLGVVNYRLNDIDSAKECLERAVAISPERPEGHVNLGYVYKSEKDMQRAVIQFEAAARIDPAYRKLLDEKK